MANSVETGQSLEQYIIKIEHIKQINNSTCGAAALEMIYLSLGITDFSQKEFYDEYKTKVNYPDTGGPLGGIMKRFKKIIAPYDINIDALKKDAYKRGLGADFWHIGEDNNNSGDGHLEAIKSFIIDYKMPFIAKLRTSIKGANHFVVVVGIDNENVYYHDPGKSNEDGLPQVVKISDFIESWTFEEEERGKTAVALIIGEKRKD